jgi:hypothetical protein
MGSVGSVAVDSSSNLVVHRVCSVPMPAEVLLCLNSNFVFVCSLSVSGDGEGPEEAQLQGAGRDEAILQSDHAGHQEQEPIAEGQENGAAARCTVSDIRSEC